MKWEGSLDAVNWLPVSPNASLRSRKGTDQDESIKGVRIKEDKFYNAISWISHVARASTDVEVIC